MSAATAVILSQVVVACQSCGVYIQNFELPVGRDYCEL